MRSFQPKAQGTPPDDQRPDDPPTPSIDSDNQPTQSEPETEPMPRSNHRNRNAEVDFKGEKRSNATHASTTDPEARLYRKSPGAGAALCFMGEMRPQKHPDRVETHCFRSFGGDFCVLH
jgi:hypothetical protein